LDFVALQLFLVKRIHIIGAGVSGLAAGVRLACAGHHVVLYESSGHAGGRCRSFHDSVLGRTIDNGNHLLLSGNRSARAFLSEIGAEDTLTGPSEAAFPFVDLQTGGRWTVRLNAGVIPWWMLAPNRRPPDTGVLDFLSVLRLAWASPEATVEELFEKSGALFMRFVEPLAVAALNTPVKTAAARPLWAVFRETFGRGGAACRPLIARDGLSRSFVEPALDCLRNRGAEVHFNRRLKNITSSAQSITQLQFADDVVDVTAAETVLLALPPANLKAVMPEIAVPAGSHAIVNAHFKLQEPLAGARDIPILGILGGVAEWAFVRGDVVSVTVSAADDLANEPASEIGAQIWGDVARAFDLPQETPPYRIVKERRATFAQTPAAMRRRPGPKTRLKNLFLAGDWTDTGLPATIESAVRSGHRAAAAISKV
jgi:squalene-associated FAD-dependent desaturase